MSSPHQLAALGNEQRNQLEAFLMDFEQLWTPASLDEFTAKLADLDDDEFRAVATAELVKIDLHRHWSADTEAFLETYLSKLPLLGSKDVVSPQLIFAEFEARRQRDINLAVESYRPRFPIQFEAFSDLVFQSPPPSKLAQASVDTSRIDVSRDTKSAHRKDFSELPTEFGRYRILRELGRGAMGCVHLAHDTQLDRQVAIKTPSFGSDEQGDLVERFYREARAAGKLQHRNICPIFDVGEIDGQHFICMAYVKGRCMSDFIKPDKLPPQKTSALLIQRLAIALGQAHRHGVIHRDLKPANVMIDLKREPVVMDFGLARDMDGESRMTQTGMAIGTPAYMSPEQVRGEQDAVGPATDIYALGVIFYELLTGQLPFRGQIAQVVYGIINEEPTAPSELKGEISQGLEAICLRMMAKQIEDRFTSMEEVATAIRSELQDNKHVNQRDKATAASPGPAKTTNPNDSLMKASASGKNELDAFLASQAAQDPLGTRVESPIASPNLSVAKEAPSKPMKPTQQVGRRTWLIGAATLLLVILLGAIFVLRTPYGTLRIETVGELKGLKVLVDGDVLSLQEPHRTKATEHELQLKLGDSYLKLNPTTHEFQLSKDGKRRRLSVTVGTTELSSSTFEVARNEETILKIELLPEKTESSSKALRDSDVVEKPTQPARQSRRIVITTEGDSRFMALSPKGNQIATTGYDSPGVVAFWNIDDGSRTRAPVRVHDAGIAQLSFAHDEDKLIFSSGRFVHLVNAANGEKIRSHEFPTRLAMAVFPKKNWVACLFFESPTPPRAKVNPSKQFISIWDWEKDKLVLDKHEISRRGGTPGQKQAANWPAISPDEKYLTVGMRHEHIRYKITANDESAYLEEPKAMQQASLIRGELAFSPDGRFAATPRKHGKSLFAILDVESGRLLLQLDDERSSDAGRGSRMAFDAAGRLVVTDYQGGVSVWNGETGSLIARLHHHAISKRTEIPPGVLVTPDGRFITSGGSADKTIVIDKLPQSP